MIGRVYRWRKQDWIVRARWAGRGPRNVLIERVEVARELAVGIAPVWAPTGEFVVRPFRGLRRA